MNFPPVVPDRNPLIPVSQKVGPPLAPLALLSLVAGLGSWVLGGGRGWAIAALLIGAVVPFTFIGIMPTNKSLLSPGRDLGSTETRSLLDHWAKLHVVRTVLSLAATILYVYLALGS
jgi:Domain of unknown function (DUF1772)